MIYSAIYVVCSVPICTVILAGLSFTKNGVKREKHPVYGSPVGQNALLMLEVRGEWAD